jgi:hypothetical protein
MSGLGERFPELQFAGAQATPSELDRYERISTGVLSVSATWVGTAAGGTSTQAKPLVLINTLLDYPRNLLYSVVGTNDMGGTWVVNGFDQFGQPITETVANGTVAAGTPAWAVAGTKIFEKVTSGTFTVTTGAVGAGSARLGVAIGTSGTTAFKLGLLTKIAGSTDVKAITWIKENVVTTLGGGTIGAYVDSTNHAFSGSAIMGGTEAYTVLLKPSWNNLNKVSLAGLA